MTSKIANFFLGYPGFHYDPNESPNQNFYDLCKHKHWSKNHPARVEAHAGFKDALVAEFNHKFGTDENSLESWQKLCRYVGIQDIPDTLAEAQLVCLLRLIWVALD